MDEVLCVYGRIIVNKEESTCHFLQIKPVIKSIQMGGIIFLIITQEDIMKEIAAKENINPATVKRVFKSAESILFTCLSSTTPTDSTCVKLLDGLSLECSYISERTIHTYEDITCKERIWVKPKVTRYYNRKLNGYFDKSR